ncbi:3',5'-cyclic adenosine monophosphate phosphodiesterase CpdA [Roseimaritima multifibrata]|uniref:3',5'-cyclic adenosine monophosphate phosphodiesterase CpdA n=1 Tax=Roseimaritima multifibrata TaxID=1930274 RepID=A0A517MNQ2_9BACT|nr:metallophosphoesterase [Roseimaritima multifibrata]QDS96501.1 3',5'-cyclic adenosine monophosphate phosphodiesterase CpdA [Roseimaritima multifibrata]
MPIHLAALTRRRVLQAAGASILLYGRHAAAAKAAEVDPDLIYLLNDTHIGEKHPTDSPVPSHLRQVVTELVQRPVKPACVLINGDLALKDGQHGDYRHFAQLIRPLQEAGIDTHLTLGNHDNREAFYEVMKTQRPDQPLVESRHISVVETAHANFFLLDSLQKTMVTQGTIGKQQLQWLTAALDASQTKPAIIVTHHNPRLGGDPVHFPGGLVDSQELWNVVGPRKWVKAYIHGHIHDRTYAQHQGIHILNMPATSYVGNPTQSTTGWTTARLSPDGIALTTHTTDAAHPWNDEMKTLTWRSA